MATLAEGGRITETLVEAEIERLRQAWAGFAQPAETGPSLQTWLAPAQIAELDVFDQLQLSAVISICRQSRSLAEAGRRLFNVSRAQKSSANDSHRLKQYLQKFGLRFDELR